MTAPDATLASVVSEALRARGLEAVEESLRLSPDDFKAMMKYLCHLSNPRPLCINGRDYHRRLKARRRRNR